MKCRLTKSYLILTKKSICILKMLVFLNCFMLLGFNSPNALSQNAIINIKSNMIVTVDEVFKMISDQTDYKFIYQDNLFDNHEKVKLEKGEIKVGDLLNMCISDPTISAEFMNNTLRINQLTPEPPLPSVEQQQTVSGTVKDGSGMPLPGVNVVEKGTSNGTTTDFDGNFDLAAAGDAVLVFSYVGFETTEIEVNNQSNIAVTLNEDLAKLDEVVVVGYGQKTKTTLTGSVSTAKGEDIIKSPQPNVSNSFAGRLSGVIALNRTGEPGDDGSIIRVRGISTTGDNDPLIVIDGVANRLGGLERINPNDIENISVLKDASAAIYGSQAANGVILITTKRGQKGKPTVSFTTNFGLTSPTTLPDMADAPTYASIINEINYYRSPSNGLNQIYSPEDIKAFANGSDLNNFPNTDWIKESIRSSSPQSNQNISVRGGGEKVNYFTSLGRTTQEGIFVGGINKFEQTNLRSNLDINLSENLKIGVDLNVRKERKHSPVRNSEDIFRAIYRTYPTIPSRYSNGLLSAGVEQGLNPIILATSQPGTSNRPSTIINATLNFEYKIPFAEGLSLKGFYSEDRISSLTKTFSKPYTVYQIDKSVNPVKFNEVIGGPNSGTAELTQAQNNVQLVTSNIRLNFDRVFDQHHINAFVAYEQQEHELSDFEAFRSGFLSTQIPEFDLGGGKPEQSSNKGSSERFTRQNYFSRVSYNYAQKYLLELQARYDGSSRFAKDSRWGFFPSVSLGWRISQEDWFDSNTVDALKIKATYGLLGNDRIDPFQYLNTFSLRPTDYVDQNNNPLPIFIIAQLANNEITWETAKKLDVGFDVAFSNGFDLEFNYFNERREDLLTSRSGSLPLVSGIVNEYDRDAIIPQENIGKVENQGIETILNFKKKIGAFNLITSANFTYNKNKVIFLDDAEGLPDYQLSKGKPLGSLLLYEAIGIFKTQKDLDDNVKLPGQQLGDLIYRDVNKDGEITELDRVRQDLTNVPQTVYGFSFGGDYKNFDFNILFQGQGKSVQYVAAESGEIGNFFSSWANNRWSPNNTNGTYPRVDVRTSSSINEGLFRSDFWLVNTAFLRLKNVELGYTLPKDVFSKIGVDSARIYFSGFNLATFTKANDVDPEGESSNGQFYPQQKIYNLGLNFNF